MTEVYIGVGSNVEPLVHLRTAAAGLADSYGLLRLSPVYRNSAVGFEGDDFYNLVIAFETDEPLADVVATLEAIENANGRHRGEEKFAARTLDLDLLLFGDAVGEFAGTQVPRDEITRYDFVLKPLLDLSPELANPATGQALAEVWDGFEQGDERLTRVDFEWTGA